MKIKRAKKVSKILTYYKQNFGFHSPYLLLLDGTFCSACLTAKVNIKDQLPKFLGEVKLLTTACCIKELEQLQGINPSVYGALMVTKTFQVYKCDHKVAKSGQECILSLLTPSDNSQHKKVHLMVATNDNSLRAKVRSIAGVPLVYLHGNCPTLEKPSGLTTKFVEKTSENKLLTLHQEKTIKELKKQVFGEPTPSEPRKKKKRKGPKGPNPLSCKKKQKRPQDNLRGVQCKLESDGKRRKKKQQKHNNIVV